MKRELAFATPPDRQHRPWRTLPPLGKELRSPSGTGRPPSRTPASLPRNASTDPTGHHRPTKVLCQFQGKGE